MNKTFKKAIAVILSVLMVIMSVPFTALAAVGDYSPNIKLQFGTLMAALLIIMIIRQVALLDLIFLIHRLEVFLLIISIK